jgi:hypothetical protein
MPIALGLAAADVAFGIGSSLLGYPALFAQHSSANTVHFVNLAQVLLGAGIGAVILRWCGADRPSRV